MGAMLGSCPTSEGDKLAVKSIRFRLAPTDMDGREIAKPKVKQMPI